MLDSPDPSSVLDRLTQAARRGIAVFIRQSTVHQALENVGSQAVQHQAVALLDRLGVPRSRTYVIDACGESGSPGVRRERFEQLERLIVEDRVGMIILAQHHRLGRDEVAAAQLFARAEAHGVLLLVGGRIFDPGDANDKLSLSIFSAFAEYENRARIRWMTMAKLALAREGRLRLALPAGLVWASPEDPAYVERAHAAGLGDWLQRAQQETAISSVKDGRRYYILPYPDRDVVLSIELRFRWLFEHQSLMGVLRDIRAGREGWPHAGRLPFYGPASTDGALVNGGRGYYRFSQRGVITWIPARSHALLRWFRSPALYGRYQLHAHSLRRRTPRLARTEPARNTLRQQFIHLPPLPSAADLLPTTATRNGGAAAQKGDA